MEVKHRREDIIVLDNVEIGFEFGHGIEVFEDGIQWSHFVTTVVD